MITVFSKQWFKKYNKWIVKLAKLPFIGEWIFCIKKFGFDLDINNLLEVQPNACVEDMKLRWTKCVKVDGQWIAYDCTNKLHNRLIKKECKEKLLPTKRTHFFVRNEFALRLQKVLYPIWITFHTWDMLIANRFCPKLNLGFDTLEEYPGSIGTNNPLDGHCYKYDDTVWSTCRDNTDSNLAETPPTNRGLVRTSFVTIWYSILRSFFLFDTSSLTINAIISNAVFSVAGTGSSSDNYNTTSIEIVSSDPASTSAIANGDYDSLGNTSYASKAISSYVTTSGTYNDFSLDANGISNISLNDISKFGARTKRDIDNSAPTGNNIVYCLRSNDSTYKPKLVVTYTLPITFIPEIMMINN